MTFSFATKWFQEKVTINSKLINAWYFVVKSYCSFQSVGIFNYEIVSSIWIKKMVKSIICYCECLQSQIVGEYIALQGGPAFLWKFKFKKLDFMKREKY